MARVLAISSHVVRGHVGLAATVPALQSLGHEVWALPTVIVASRPGLGRMARHEPPATGLADMLAALEADGCWPSLDAVLTGYFASPEAVAAAAQAIRRIRAVNPRALVLVDPVLGDAGRLYVAAGDGRCDPARAAAPGHGRHAQPVRAAVADRHGCARHRRRGASSRAAGPRHGRGHVRCRNRRDGDDPAWSPGASGSSAPPARMPASPTAPATCSPGCCWATC